MNRIVSLKQAQGLKGQLRHWAYNALDCTGTREIMDNLHPMLDDDTRKIYAFERAVQAPAFAMSRRGIKINVEKRKEAARVVKRDLRKIEKRLNAMPEISRVWDNYVKVTGICPKSTRKDNRHTWEKGVEDTPKRKCVSCGTSRMTIAPFNPNSHHQCRHLLYDLLGLPLQFNKDKAVTTDDEALQKLSRKKPKTAKITDAILEARGLKKQLALLEARLTPDERFPISFNVGTAWTGRWSSSKSPFGEGGNGQNIAERHRHIFEADNGYTMCYADLKQAESNIVAHLAGDEGYIEAHASGDVHTYVTRIIWPDLPWTGDLAKDKAIAKQNPEWDQAPGHGFRFQSKRIQHGCNYGLTPFGIAIIAHIPLEAAKQAFHAYHSGFPGIREWQRNIRKAVQGQEALVNPLGRKIRLFGRPWDEHTYKQGLSFLPQSAVADIINIAVWRVWKELEIDGDELVQLLAQVHDALLFQYPDGRTDDVIPQVMKLMTVPVPILGADGKMRTARVETEAAIGKNWGKKNDSNPNGLVEIV